MMQLTKKHNKIQALYTPDGTVLENVESIKYLGVTITSDLKWNSHRHRTTKSTYKVNRASSSITGGNCSTEIYIKNKQMRDSQRK